MGEIMPEFKTALTRDAENQPNPFTLLSLIAGLGFMIGSILKFKQHKDNPTNIPLAVPVALFIAGLGLILFGIKQPHTGGHES
jgi:intracellular multiplication protein IcmD